MSAARPIEIVGGGLAGLSLGLALRRAGVDVTLFEAGQYPRHRVCGEFITGLPPATRARLQLDAVLGDAVCNREVAWFARGSVVRRHTLPTPALSLSRHVLDARLANAFVAAGGKLNTGTRVVPDPGRPGQVIATGRKPARSPWIGLKLHLHDLPLLADLELHLGDSAYVGLARIEEDQVNLCGLFRRRGLTGQGAALITTYLEAAGLSELARRIGEADVDANSFCAVAAVAFDRRVSPAAPLRIGDACAVIPPFTGHGMAMAFQSADLAATPLLRYAQGGSDWPTTQDAVHRALRRRFRIRLASAACVHSFLLNATRQRWLERLNRVHLLPLRPLYAAMHA